MVSSATQGGSALYSYDEVGNRISFNSTQYTYNAVNEVVSASDGTTFSYDQNGNMVGKTGEGTEIYQYNAADELTQVEHNGQVTGQYSYDGDGRRIQKTEWTQQGFKTTTYIYYGLNILYEKDTDTGMDALSIYGPTGKIAKKAGGALYFYHTDHLGSVRLVTDETGTVVTAEEYQPFGTHETKGEPERYVFTGKEEDASRLYYYGARYYDPEIGRFLTRDPDPGELINPQSLNRYTYCLNNPLRYIDRWGLSASSGGCDCIDRKDIQDLLKRLETENMVIEDIENRIKEFEDYIKRSMSRYYACLDFINELGFQIPGLIYGNRDFETWQEVKSLLKEILPEAAKYILEKKGHSFLARFIGIVGEVLTAWDYIRLAYCIAFIQGLFTTDEAITIWKDLKKKHETNRDTIINEIRERCECALPEEYR